MVTVSLLKLGATRKMVWAGFEVECVAIEIEEEARVLPGGKGLEETGDGEDVFGRSLAVGGGVAPGLEDGEVIDDGAGFEILDGVDTLEFIGIVRGLLFGGEGEAVWFREFGELGRRRRDRAAGRGRGRGRFGRFRRRGWRSICPADSPGRGGRGRRGKGAASWLFLDDEQRALGIELEDFHRDFSLFVEGLDASAKAGVARRPGRGGGSRIGAVRRCGGRYRCLRGFRFGRWVAVRGSRGSGI